MSGANALAGVPLPDLVREHALKHPARIERAEDLIGVSLALERAEGYGEGLEIMRGINPADLEALYIAFDSAATARRQVLEG